MIRHLKDAFGEMRLGALTRRGVEDRLAAMPTPAAANYALRLLKSILRDAVDHEVLPKNPTAGIKPCRVEDDGKEVLHILTPDQIGRLLAASREPYTLLYETAVGTGLRRGELLGLRWGDLDLHKGVLYVRRSRGAVKDGAHDAMRVSPVKTRHSRRTVDLSPILVQRLQALRQEQAQRTKVVPLYTDA